MSSPDQLFRFLLCLAVAVTLPFWIERFILPKDVRNATQAVYGAYGPGIDIVCRVVIYTLFFLLFFSISWRPIYAATATASASVIAYGFSRWKYGFVREPLVFTDFAMVPALLNHKSMFYAGFVNFMFWTGALVYIFGASTLFYVFEPPVLPANNRPIWIAGVLILALLPVLVVSWRPARSLAGGMATDIIGKVDPTTATLRLGTMCFFFLQILEWMTFEPDLPNGHRATAIAEMETHEPNEDPPLVIVWQSESFYDMRHVGADIDLPNLDRLRARAAAWGRMRSMFEGGYTMRTEFSVICGLAESQLGPDASFPYLRPGRYVSAAWPALLREAGWSTVFVHPYDERFFLRNRALPELGFDRLVMAEAFSGPERGPYVSDAQLTERVVDLCEKERSEPLFIVASSMENHGPWKAGDGRSDETKPLNIYLDTLKRSDRALADLVERLDGMNRKVWLAFYGDHAPLLKRHAKGFSDPRTEYLLLAAGTARRPPAEGAEATEAALLLEKLVKMAGTREA